MMVSFVLSFFPRDVLDEILKLIESVSEDFPSYSSMLDWPVTICVGNGYSFNCLWWSFCAVLFPRDVLDEILDRIESVLEGIPTYSLIWRSETLVTNVTYGHTNLLPCPTPPRRTHSGVLHRQSDFTYILRTYAW